MEKLDIELFNPKKEELQKLALACQKIDGSDLKLVTETRIKLKKARVDITKQGKEMRDEANKFAKDVIAREKELVAIIEPEELRLEAIEDEVKEQKLKEERIALLPIRREQLDAIGDDVVVTDEELLGMDTAFFADYKNIRVANKNESDRLALEAERRKIQEEADRQQREKETQEREKKAREEAQAEAERKLAHAKEEAELRVQQEKADADRRVKEAEEKAKQDAEREKQRVAQEKADAEAKAKAEQEALDKKKKYQAWLTKNEYDEKTHYLRNENGVITLYKIISSYKI